MKTQKQIETMRGLLQVLPGMTVNEELKQSYIAQEGILAWVLSDEEDKESPLPNADIKEATDKDAVMSIAVSMEKINATLEALNKTMDMIYSEYWRSLQD